MSQVMRTSLFSATAKADGRTIFGTFYPIISTHLPVYSQGHLVMALLVLSLGKPFTSTDNIIIIIIITMFWL